MIQTVTGAISGAELGAVLMHEHISCSSLSFAKAFGEAWLDQEQIRALSVEALRELKSQYGVALLVDGTPIDLGRDVSPEQVLEEALATRAPLVCLSALMTTTVPAMEETVKLLHEQAPFCRVMVGGAVLNAEYAAAMGADHYAADAMGAVRYAEEIDAQAGV